jgi:lipopolysaccharide biosynthesis glycosyltransferase
VSETISVAFALDPHYAVHTGVTMFSVLRRAKEPERFCFCIIEGNQPLPEAIRRQYKALTDEYGARLRWQRFDSSYFDTLPRGQCNHKGLTSGAHYRTYIPELFPDLGKCIYLDGDVIAMDDLTRLWDGEDVEGFSQAAVHFRKIPAQVLALYPHLRTYFNSGVLLMNLRYWREHGLVEQYLTLTRNSENLRYHTQQDAMNGICASTCKVLHPRWNVMGDPRDCVFPPGGTHEAAPALIHFAGDKPWNGCMRHPWSMEYWRVRAQSPWWDPERVRGIWLCAYLNRWKAQMSNLCRISLKPGRGRYRVVLFGRTLVDIAGVTEVPRI